MDVEHFEKLLIVGLAVHHVRDEYFQVVVHEVGGVYRAQTEEGYNGNITIVFVFQLDVQVVTECSRKRVDTVFIRQQNVDSDIASVARVPNHFADLVDCFFVAGVVCNGIYVMFGRGGVFDVLFRGGIDDVDVVGFIFFQRSVGIVT
jgi:hypothetical protein